MQYPMALLAPINSTASQPETVKWKKELEAPFIPASAAGKPTEANMAKALTWRVGYLMG
jgi:hypothetical protein